MIPRAIVVASVALFTSADLLNAQESELGDTKLMLCAATGAPSAEEPPENTLELIDAL